MLFAPREGIFTPFVALVFVVDGSQFFESGVYLFSWFYGREGKSRICSGTCIFSRVSGALSTEKILTITTFLF